MLCFSLFLLLLLSCRRTLNPPVCTIRVGADEHQLHLLITAREEAGLITATHGTTNGMRTLQGGIQDDITMNIQTASRRLFDIIDIDACGVCFLLIGTVATGEVETLLESILLRI